MSDSPLLPGQHGWKDASGKPLPVEFYRFLRDLVAYLRQSGANTADIAALEARIAALEAGGTDATLQGLESVRLAGTLAGGLVQFRLQGDAANPGPSLYYGTDENGVKGFWPALSNPMTTLGDIIVGGTDGVPARVGVGDDGDVLTVVAGSPEWAPPASGSGIVETIVPGTGITVDDTDPANPIVSAAAVAPDWAKPVGFSFAPIGTSTPVHYLGDNAPGFTPLSASSLTANRLYYLPFSVPYNITLATLGLNLQGTSAGNKARVGIYDTVVTSGKVAPGNLLSSTSDLSLNSAVVVTSASTQVLEAGKLYWLGVLTNAGVSVLSAASSNGTLNLGRISSANHNAYTHVYQTIGAGWSALPSSAASLTAGSGSVPVGYVTFT